MRLLRLLRPTILDRYVVAEVLPPTALGLLVFTFLLLMQQITVLTGVLISRGADLPTILQIFVRLLPSIFSVTLPMAFLLGLLLAFGRLASDSEIVALRASGVSPLQLLRPVVALSLLTGSATFYTIAYAVPAANQEYREVFYSLVVSRARTGVKPRVFTDDLLQNTVLYVSDVASDTGEWRDLLLSDRTNAQEPKLIVARSGRLVIDRQSERVDLHLEDGTIHKFSALEPEKYEEQRFVEGEFPLPYEQFFPRLPLAKGDRELTLGELRERADSLRAEGKADEAPRYEVELHKKFAIPAACFVFGLVGLGLSLGSRREARSAAFGLSAAIITVYYIVLRLGEQAGDTGMLSPFVAMWGANLVLGAAGVALIVLNHREAAFDPLDPGQYAAWLPRIRRSSASEKLPPAGRVESRRSRQRPGQPVVVLRIPRLSLRIPGLIDRYIARQYAQHVMLVLAGFWAVFLVFHFLDLFDDVQQHGVKGKTVLHYYAFYSPEIIHLIAPVAVLVATLVTFGLLARRNEITAMKAGGISVYRAAVPVLAMGLLASVCLFGMGEFLLPYTNRIAEQDYNVIKGRPAQSSSYLDRRWIVGSDGRFYNYDYMSEIPGSQDIRLFGLSVYDIDPETWRLRDRLGASRAFWNGFTYDLERGWRRTFGEHGSFREFDAIRTREIEPPTYFKREERAPDTLSFPDLREHIGHLEQLGYDVIRLRVQLHRKLAFPMLGVVMTLIGIPFAFVVGRRGALHGIAISILVAMVYWACLGIFEAMGNNALLPPVLAAWAPNLLFAAAGLYLTLTLET